MTEAQLERRARKYRLVAGGLYYDLSKAQRDNLPSDVLECIRTAHDAMCEAFNRLEDHSTGFIK